MAAKPEVRKSLRIDKWLWHARFCKTRAIAQTRAIRGHIRLNGRRVEKPGTVIRAGDIMTLVAGGRVMVLRVLALGERCGPALEARTLYEIIEDA
jgi:ribosome-associated heat shock protein Hsp15